MSIPVRNSETWAKDVHGHQSCCCLLAMTSMSGMVWALKTVYRVVKINSIVPLGMFITRKNGAVFLVAIFKC
jgi:hypothetical protein